MSIAHATIEARKRLADAGIATRAEGGYVQIIRYHYDADDQFQCVPLSHWLCPFEVEDALANLPPEGYL